MAKYAELADGRILEFPDDIPQDVMDKAVKRAVENPYSTYTDQGVTGYIAGNAFKQISINSCLLQRNI